MWEPRVVTASSSVVAEEAVDVIAEVDMIAVIERLNMQHLEMLQRKIAVVVVDLGIHPLG